MSFFFKFLEGGAMRSYFLARPKREGTTPKRAGVRRGGIGRGRIWRAHGALRPTNRLDKMIKKFKVGGV
jgi:hypothetical protein